MMARGYIGKGWMDAVPTARHPTGIMNKLQRMVWMEFFEPLWQNRNKLFHQQKNNYTRANDALLAEKLTWLHSNRHSLLVHHNHFLFHNIATTTIHTIPTRQIQEWLRHLTIAKSANTQELTLRKTNQRSLFRYMTPVNAPPATTPTTHLPGEEPNTPQKQGRKNLSWQEHTSQTCHT